MGKHTALLRHERQVHLHHLHLGERLPLAYVVAHLQEIPRQLATVGRAQHRGVVLLREHAGHSVYFQSETGRSVLEVNHVGLTIGVEKESAVGKLADLHLRGRSVGGQRDEAFPAKEGVHAVLGVLVDEIVVVARAEQLAWRDLTAPVIGEVAGLVGLEAHESAAGRRHHHHEGGVGFRGLEVASQQPVQPGRVNRIPNVTIVLHQAKQVLDGRADFASNAEFAQCLHHVLSSDFARGSPAEEVAELRVGVLMHAATAVHREVAPDIHRAAEVQLADGAAGGLEAGIRVFGRNAAGDDVAAGSHGREGVKGDAVHPVLVVLVESTDVADAVERDAHGDLQLGGGQVHVGDHLCDGVLHLQTRVQLQERVRVVLHKQGLHRASVGVPHQRGQADGRQLHVAPDFGRRGGGGTFFDDLLVAALHAAITAAQRDHVAILVS